MTAIGETTVPVPRSKVPASLIHWGMEILLFTIAASGMATAQSQNKEAGDATSVLAREQKREAERARALVEGVTRLPFEYRADIQLTAIESGRTRSPQWEEKMLDALFRDAGQAQYPYKERDATGNRDARSMSLEGAFGLNLDGLSVRLRVIRAMLKRDPKKARRLLNEIRLGIPSSPCSSTMVYDVSDYYKVWTEVSARQDKKQEKVQADEALLLQQHFWALTSPVQLTPLAHLITGTERPHDELNSLAYLFAQQLYRLQATDRELAFIDGKQELTNAIRQIMEKSGKLAPAIVELVRAYRDFLVRSTTPVHCADITADRAHLLLQLNRMLEDFAHGSGIAALNKQDLEASKTGDSAQVELIPDAGKISSGLLGRISKVLNVASAIDSSPYPGNWEADADEMLQRIVALDTSNGPCRICLFYEKESLFFFLFALIPGGTTKEQILEHYISFLADDPAQMDSPIEWLFRFKILLNTSRKPSKEQLENIAKFQKGRKLADLPGGPSEMSSRMLEIFKQQKNEIIQAYLMADGTLKIPYALPPYVRAQ